MLPFVEQDRHDFYGGPVKISDPVGPTSTLLVRVTTHVRTYLKAYASLAGSVLLLILFTQLVDVQDAGYFILDKAHEASTRINHFMKTPEALVAPVAPETHDENLHILIPTNKGDVNLCKTLLGTSLLGYPTPTLVAWEENFDRAGILGGGSHVAKVQRVLDYLNALAPEQDEDLVFMIDAYDIWFQLPQSTLIERYHTATRNAQARLIDEVGLDAVAKHNLLQLVIFGSGKRCAPNQPQTVACYAIPESPLPDDLYGNNTDTVIGHNVWYSNKQRYLNSGFILGPAGAMRKMFEQAWQLIQEHPAADPNDNGSHGSDLMYHGSDQSIFADMFGKQEWVREKLRLQHARPGAKPRSSQVWGTEVDNILDPSFTHEHFDPDLDNGNPYEFGMHLDYWSDFGHQTINSEVDACWITYEGAEKTPKEQCGKRTQYDCPMRIPETLPDDLVNTTVSHTDDEFLWEQRHLYTHLCTGRIPIMIHHNGMKERRQQAWPQIWYQPSARFMFSDLQEEFGNQAPSRTLADHMMAPRQESAGGAWTDKGAFMQWDDLCPSDWDKEIFRDL